MAFVPDRQDAGDHWAWILQDFVKVQAVDIADDLDQVYVQIDGVVIAAADFEIGEGYETVPFVRF